MLSRFRLPMLFLLAVIVLFTSCSKSNKQGRYIPKTAAIVILVNGESLSAKLPWEEVKQNELFKNLYSDSSLEAYIKTALDNPDNTGIDTKKDFLFFVLKDSAGGYVAIEGTVKDAAKFKAFNSSATKTIAETEKDGIHFLSNNRMSTSWDKEKFVIVLDAPEINSVNNYNKAFDSTSSNRSIAKRDLNAVCTGIYALKEANSLAKDEKFTELVSEKGDIQFWMNAAALNSGSAGMAALSMLNMSKLYEGSVITASTNFEDGKIDILAKSYSGKELTEIWKKYAGDKINMDMIKRLPTKDIAVLFALNFKPEGIREFIKLAGLDGFANMGTAFLGFNLDDFIKANKGDILFSLSDIKKDSMGSSTPNILFSASIGDKNSFGKLIEAGKKLGRDKLGSDAPPIAFYNTNNDYFAIGTKKESVDKYFNTSGNSSVDFLDKISGSPSALYVNFQLLLSSTLSDMASRDSLDNVAYNATIKMWENLIATGGGYKNGGVTQHMEINLVDKKTNSLKQLNSYLGTMGTIQKIKKEMRDKMLSESMIDDGNETISDAETKAVN